MRSPEAATRAIAGLACLALIAACGAGASPTPVPATPAPSPVVETDNVAYQPATPLTVPGELDVYAPAKAGPWPVIVMFHGAPDFNEKGSLGEHAWRVAQFGFVVFVPSWGHSPKGAYGAPGYEQMRANLSEAACAVAFARANAGRYGGDPATMIVFGHSGGAGIATMVALASTEPSPDCLGGTTLGAVDTLVTWEGDWNAIDPLWDDAIAADPRLVDLYTPWKHLAAHKDLKVVMLVSQGSKDPATPYQRPLADQAAIASFFALRDPSGALRRQLEANGAFTDGSYSLGEEQDLLFSVLKAQGNPVSFAVMPDSTHDGITGDGWDVFLAAFKALAHS